MLIEECVMRIQVRCRKKAEEEDNRAVGLMRSAVRDVCRRTGASSTNGGHASSLQVSRGKAGIDCREPERVEYLASSTPSAALNHFHPNWVRHPPLCSLRLQHSVPPDRPQLSLLIRFILNIEVIA